jgi:(1->4)-alpha-D-glucan 1-alpha-D-glucosylmutase
VRARITALSSLPYQWAHDARLLLELSEQHCARVGDRPAPDLVERYFILQTLVGAWPIAPQRLDGYLEKALREAKRNTSWIEPAVEYEAAVKRFVRALVADPEFLEVFEPLLDSVLAVGSRNVLGQLAIKLTAPGVPDTYQGDELEFTALVDPDNRRPVDWELRQTQLARMLGGGLPGEELSGRKLWLTTRLLGLRARRVELFVGAGYEPLDGGEAVCAYLRGGAVLTVVELPRGDAEAFPVVKDLPGGRWREVLTGIERSFDRRETVTGLVDPMTGVGVYERL